MTVSATAAPTSAAPAPAAPAAAAPAPNTPAPAGPSNRVAGMFDHLGIEEKQAPVQPQMDHPLGDVTQPEAPKPPEAAKPPEPSQPLDPKDPKAAKPGEPQPPKKWAGRFDRPEDLEVAYTESSKEGRRLASMAKETQAALDKTTQELSILRLEKEMGPELKDLTDDQMAGMTPQAIALHVAKQSEQRQAKIRLTEKMEQKDAAEKANLEATTKHIISTAQAMERDTARYPDYGELKPIISELMDFEPGLTGHRNTPMILYLAAKGIRAAEAEKVAKTATDESAETARRKAAADASAAGNTGAPGSEKTPAGLPAGIDPNSDAAHNMALLKGVRPKPVFG